MVGLKPKPKFMESFQFMGAESKPPMRLENNSSEPSSGSELSLTGYGLVETGEGRLIPRTLVKCDGDRIVS